MNYCSQSDKAVAYRRWLPFSLWTVGPLTLNTITRRARRAFKRITTLLVCNNVNEQHSEHISRPIQWTSRFSASEREERRSGKLKCFATVAVSSWQTCTRPGHSRKNCVCPANLWKTSTCLANRGRLLHVLATRGRLVHILTIRGKTCICPVHSWKTCTRNTLGCSAAVETW